MTKKTIFRIWFKLIRRDLGKIREFIRFIVYLAIGMAPITTSFVLARYGYDILALILAILGFIWIWLYIRLVEAYNTAKEDP